MQAVLLAGGIETRVRNALHLDGHVLRATKVHHPYQENNRTNCNQRTRIERERIISTASIIRVRGEWGTESTNMFGK